MSVAELLGALRERGIELRADGERLRCVAPPGALTDELSAQIRKEKVAILEVLRAATQRAEMAPIPHVEDHGRFPLSFTQLRAVLSGRINGALPTAFLFRGELNRDALDQTLRRFVERHAPLRSRFFLSEDASEQEFLEHLSFDVPTTDFSTVDAGERPGLLQTKLAELSRVTFDVTQPPLFRFHLIILGPTEHVLHTAFNVLVFDGWSFDVFWHDLREGYAALSKGEAWPSAPLPVSYPDFVTWQRSRADNEIARQGEFWRKALGAQLPPLPLPTDHVRPRRPTLGGGGYLPLDLPSEAAVMIRRFAQQQSATPQMVMLTALYGLLARLGSTDDVVVATPIDARTHPSIEGMLGPVVNMLLLRAHIDVRHTFVELLAQIRDQCLASYENQEFPLERLEVRSPRGRGGSLAPAFQVELSYQQVSQRGSHMGSLSITQLELESGASTSDLTLWVKDWGERISGAVEFKPDLFEQATIEHWIRCYKHWMRELVRSADKPLAEVDLLGPERALVELHLAAVAAKPPAWIRQAVGEERLAPPATLQIVDQRNQLCPMGVAGVLAVVGGGTVRRTNLHLRLASDGTVHQVHAEAQPAPAVEAAKPEGPRSELEMRICVLFEELLGLEKVGVEQDYFELGGNSLLAVRLFASIQQQFGVRLPLATIVDAGTPRLLAKAVKEKFPNRTSCVVRLKEGEPDRALFLIHDGDGETLLYRNLALMMPAWVAVYGIEPVARGRLPMVHTTVEDMASAYLQEIRKLQPRGPYFLGGLCAGGLIAFEIARQLEAFGEEIRCLALFEASPPQAKKRATVAELRWQRFRGVFDTGTVPALVESARKGMAKLQGYLRFEAGYRWRRARSRSLFWALRHVFPKGEGWPASLPVLTARDVFDIAEKQYVPSRLGRTRAFVYRATQGDDGDRPLQEILVDPLFGWQELLDHPAVAIDVPGGHSTMLREGHVAMVASHLRASYESLQKESAPAQPPATPKTQASAIQERSAMT